MTTSIEPLLQAIAPRVRIARASDRVYRDECSFSFDTAFSPDGIYTNLTTLQSFGATFVALDRARSPQSAVYLHQRHTKMKKPKTGKDEPSKLAIGGEGGFSVNAEDKYDVVKNDQVVVFDSASGEPLAVAVDAPVVPARIQEAIQALLNHAGNTVVEEVATWVEQRKESPYADHLIQVDPAPKISSNPSSWKCMAPDCDKQENLWLNLSDGFIGCGRRNWDGTGGCGEALRHYQATGSMYPLAVKLGTITAEGGDVYSYAPEEDDMVTDKHLTKHLAHFGINISNLQKTEKTMDELQVGLNLNYEFDAITESGAKLVGVSGAGHIGFKNLGNSCYMNSVLQLLLTLPEIRRRYLAAATTIFSTCGDSPADDFAVQFAKLAAGVLTDRYKRQVKNDNADDEKKQESDDDVDLTAIDLRPITFRGLVGKGHADFATGQQQDAVEYFQHMMAFMDRSERVAAGRIGPLLGDGEDSEKAQLPTSTLFKFAVEDRVECLSSNKVKYVAREESYFQLQIPVDAATNATQVRDYQAQEQKRQKIGDAAASTTDDKVVPNVPFQACLEKTLAPELIEDFLSSATGKKGLAQKTVRFKSFPRYLLVQMRRFYVAEDWTPKKMDVVVTVPETLNLSSYLSSGIQQGEELLPEDTSSGAGATAVTTSTSAEQVTPDEELVVQLVSMGFSENGCKRAAVATGNSNAEAAMEWIFNHMEDADFNEPLPVGGSTSSTTSSSGATSSEFNEDHIVSLTSMGFTEDQVKCALSQTGKNPERAGDWLFNHMDSLDAEVAMWKSGSEGASSSINATTGSGPQPKLDNEVGQYSLVGFISHIGRNTNSGHYVCHIKKEGRWVIFNDDKVALSTEPPLGAGYLYFFRRNDIRQE